MSCKYQLTLALLKPDVAVNPAAIEAVFRRIRAKNISILRRKILYWNEADAKLFYHQHNGKFFYQRLVEYAACGPVMALVLAGGNAIREWRQLMGPTKTFQAGLSHPYSLRGEFGLSDTRNSTHGSDSEDSARKEIEATFGQEYEIATGALNSGMSNLHLGLPRTWEALYQRKVGERFDWFLGYKELEEYILPIIKSAIIFQNSDEHKNAFILDIGCGESLIGPNIAKSLGRSVSVYCIDFVMKALLRLRREIDSDDKFDNVKNCYFIKADVSKSIPFQDGSVAAVIDKGTIDSILKQSGGTERVNHALANVLRLLHHNGVFLQITDEPPEIRMDILQHAASSLCVPFTVSCRDLSDGSGEQSYFLYCMRKL